MIKNNYLYNVIYSSIDSFTIQVDSTYIYGYSTEGRSHIVDTLVKKYNTSVTFVQIEEKGNDTIFDFNSKKSFNLRSSRQVVDFLMQYDFKTLYLDVSGLNNRVSASLLNNFINNKYSGFCQDLRVIYAEPESYKIERFKSEGVFNDLSEQINGILPLPGFESIIPEENEDVVFIALLGFEGGRFMHIIEAIQPLRDQIIPVIGVPGYRLEYPFVAFWGNRRAIEETSSWRNIKFVSANSIADVYYLLNKLLDRHQNKKIKVAPIGTKPHAIGAILFAIMNKLKVELIYDNPVRKKIRTSGVGKIVECNISNLLADN